MRSLLSGLLLTIAAPLEAQLLFDPPVNLSAGGGSIAVVVGDLNRDGKPDAVTANWYSHTLDIYLGDGSGASYVASSIPAASNPRSLALGDVNCDGKPDLVAALSQYPGGSIGVYLGDGAGGFAAPVTFVVGAPETVVLGDFNGDGSPDIAFTNAIPVSLGILLGDGEGGFSSQPSIGLPGQTRSLAAGDLNRDGDLDLVAVTFNTVAVYLGDGSGTFFTETDFPTGQGHAFDRAAALGDVNRDGKLDVVTANFVDNTVSVLLGDGAGGLSPMTTFATANDPKSVTIADVDGDGKLDLAVAHERTAFVVGVLVGDGTGGFAPRVDFPAGDYPQSVAAGDFNDDGRPDLVSANLSGVSFLLNTTPFPKVGNSFSVHSAPGGSNNRSVALGDFNRDGIPDLVAADFDCFTGGGGVLVFPGDGAGNFGSSTNIAPGVCARDVIVADFNGDGRPDIAYASNFGPNIGVVLGDGAGGFAPPVGYSSESGHSLAVGDINHDGKPDLVSANATFPSHNTVSVYLNDGSGGFPSFQTFPTDPAMATHEFDQSVALADLNRDCHPDIVVANYGANNVACTVSVLLGDGTGDFGAHADYPTGLLNLVGVWAGDLDGDGIPDVIAVTSAPNVTSQVAVLWGDGTGALSAPLHLPTGYGPTSSALADINRDGKLDILTANFFDNTISVIRGDGQGGFGQTTGYGAGGGLSMAVADLNRDGKLDIVTNALTILLNEGVPNSAPTATAQDVTTAEDTPVPLLLAATDPDGDPNVSFAVVTSPAHGILTGTAPNLTYTPAANYNGSDSFTFTASDASATSAEATVSITIDAANDAPAAQSQDVTTGEDTGKLITLSASDIDSAGLTFAVVSGPAHGSLGSIGAPSCAPSGAGSSCTATVTYTPAADYNGPDSFTFKANDGGSDSAAATVSIDADAVNDAPAANGQSVTTFQDGLKQVTLSASDIDSAGLTFSIAAGPAHGALGAIGAPDCSPGGGGSSCTATVTYTPATGYTGADSFTFKANDGALDSAAATVNVTVTPATKITSFTPTSGAEGRSVTINGTNFTGASAVKFNGLTSTFTVNTAIKITAAVPAGATTGTISVTTALNTATSAGTFAVAPRIDSFSPSSGAPGSSVVITGLNFTGASSVKFNGAASGFTVNSPTQITAGVPASATTGKITVTSPAGTATSAATFTVAPRITSFTPASGPYGTSVTINGANFTGAMAVRFNGTNATFTVNSGIKITAPVPSGSTTGLLTVEAPAGTATSATPFTVTFLPTISSFSPTSGAPGLSVVITGTNFSGATSVKFNGTAASFAVNSGTQITAIVPSNATTGTLTVTTPAGTATSASAFTVAPKITNFTPTSGPVGTVVTINGLNFTGASSVKFNGISAASFTVVSSTKITAPVPASATTGKVSVTTSVATFTSANNFTVSPKITSFTPGSGAPGTPVVITGTTFTGVTSVKFNGLAAGFTFNSSTQVTANVPNNATSGAITLTTPAGTTTSPTTFIVAPRITSFTPASGPVGTSVAITGANLTLATSVKFGGVSATTFTVNTASKITATVPAGAVTGQINVTTSAGTATSAASFTVTP